MRNLRNNGSVAATSTITAGVDPLAYLKVEELRADLRRISEIGPVGGAFSAIIVTSEIRQAYRSALLARDEAAAYLYGTHSWSAADVAEVICGHRTHDARASVIIGWTTRPAHLGDAAHEVLRRQQIADSLRKLLSEARTVTIRRLDQAELPLPTGPLERVHKATDVARYVGYHLDSVIANRNVSAANLVVHHGWQLNEVALMSDVEPEAIESAYTAARLSPPSDADSLSVRELTAIIAALRKRITHWHNARDDAVAECLALGMDPELVAAHAGVPALVS